MIGLLKHATSKRRGRISLPPAEERLRAVLAAAVKLSAGADLTAALTDALKSAIRTTGASCGYVMLVEEIDGEKFLGSHAVYATQGEIGFPQTLRIGEGLSGFVAKMGQTVAVSSNEQETPAYDGVSGGIGSGASTPLLMRTASRNGRAAQDEVLGVLTLFTSDCTKAFTKQQIELLKGFGAQMSMALSMARMDAMRQETIIETLSRVATALEARDRFFKGHSLRVCELSQRIAEKLGFDRSGLDELRLGTILLDLGKVYVPDTVLNKITPLTESEFEVLKLHTVRGYELCSRLGLSETAMMIIRNHHEKLDGTGYPDKLRGSELPLALRIVCVADSFDAMISKRPHRDAMSIEHIISELSRVAGKHYDPLVVETLKLLNSTGMLKDLYPSSLNQLDSREAA